MIAPGQLRRAVFLDRDGTINKERDYLSDPDELELIPGAAEAIARLNAAGFFVAVVTNQSGVARGYFALDAVHRIHRALGEMLVPFGAQVDAWYICPHHPSAGEPPWRRVCNCRKGRPGLLLQAAEEHGLDLSRSFMVGDKCSDVQAGLAAGCCSLLVKTGYGGAESEKLPPGGLLCENLAGAVESILEKNVGL